MRTLTGLTLAVFACAACVTSNVAPAGPTTPSASGPRVATARPSASPTPARPSASADPRIVEALMGDHFFEPAVIRVRPGTTVTWRLASGVHDVTALDGLFRSGPLVSGAFSFTFTQVGRHRYFCSIHPGEMRAEVVVEPSN